MGKGKAAFLQLSPKGLGSLLIMLNGEIVGQHGPGLPPGRIVQRISDGHHCQCHRRQNGNQGQRVGIPLHPMDDRGQ
ncbi:hypothetical protein D3C73_680030 [compost metagenome]